MLTLLRALINTCPYDNEPEQSKSPSKAKGSFSPAPHKVIGANWFGGAMNIAAATPFQKWTGPLRRIKV